MAFNILYPSKGRKRQSQYELLRLISQFYIVLYHICYMWQGSLKNNPFFQAIGIPLHIGVIIFVLLSGFFTINATSKGLIKLLGIFIVYDSSEIIYNLINTDSIRQSIKHLALLSDTHFWFIKTYLILFAYILYTFLIICICIVTDKLLTPIWIKINNFGDKVYMKIDY